MKINFKALNCRPSLKSEETFDYDITLDMADAIYQNTTRFEDIDLAMAIASSTEPLDLTPEQVDVVMKYASSFPVWIQIGIINAINTPEEEIAQPGAEMIFEEEPEQIAPEPGTPAPDGGVWAGIDGVPAPVEVVETVPQVEVPLVEENDGLVVETKKVTRKSKKK